MSENPLKKRLHFPDVFLFVAGIGVFVAAIFLIAQIIKDNFGKKSHSETTSSPVEPETSQPAIESNEEQVQTEGSKITFPEETPQKQ
jgi:hypothetical protein